MKIVLTGATGLIGQALQKYLRAQRHAVIRLSRNKNVSPPDLYWNPPHDPPKLSEVKDVDAVVHLAGENIAEGRWTEKKKRAIRDSRVQGTATLVQAISQMSVLPKVVVSGSAIGYYGDRSDEILTEKSESGSGFLPEVCRAWENAVQPLISKGVRVVNLRTGIVLARDGGALAKMLTPFKLGVGGVLGPGNQYMSWITLDEIVSVIAHALNTSSLQGPLNAVAPQAVMNAEFTKTLGRVLGRPTVFPMPAFAARLAFGEMADALLLASTRVRPAVLEQSGYAFQTPGLETALRSVLDKK